eukprot:13163167-Alexandrium_andersonii.AAC.1
MSAIARRDRRATACARKCACATRPRVPACACNMSTCGSVQAPTTTARTFGLGLPASLGQGS